MAKPGDPRSHRRYTTQAATYIQARQDQHVTCILCHQPVNMAAPRTNDAGPTIEHRIPIRTIIKQAANYHDAVNQACDTSSWAIAHRGCQNEQGAAAANQRAPRTPSRNW